MIRVSVKGDWGNTEKMLRSMKRLGLKQTLDKYGALGVEALKKATPVDTGTTAASWRYEVVLSRNGGELVFHNDNVNQHVNIALIVNYGHATGQGVWVEGRHYIEPAIQETFDKMVDELWKEVKQT